MKKQVGFFLAFIFISALVITGLVSTNSTAHDIESTDLCPAYNTNGAISGLYLSYDPGYIIERPLNPLGCPSSPEMPFSAAGIQGRYQEFDHGSIYYNTQEGSAFALFNDVDVMYKNDKDKLGMPITSEIGNANASPATCRAYFKLGWIQCASNGSVETPRYWADTSPESIMKKDFPSLKMPFSKGDNNSKGSLSGGPHEWYADDDFKDILPTSNGSGVDIGGRDMVIVAMASGTVVDMYPNPEKSNEAGTVCTTRFGGLGCWVAIRHDFGGSIIIYGHIQPDPNIKIGSWIKQSNKIGSTKGSTIGDGDPHVHLEFRDGTNICTVRCISMGAGLKYGQPIDWHGVVIDNQLISAGFTTSGQRYNYDGTAVEVSSLSKTKYSQNDLVSLWAVTCPH